MTTISVGERKTDGQFSSAGNLALEVAAECLDAFAHAA
jgi:hypothetical protein